MKKRCSKDNANDLWKYIIGYATNMSEIQTDDAAELPMDKQMRINYENAFKANKIMLINCFELVTGFKPIESINVVTNEPAWRLENDITSTRT